MRALTLHQIDDGLYEGLVEESKRLGWSLNKTAKKLLGDKLGINKGKKKKYRDLSEFVGMWTKEEGDRFDKLIEENFEQIDEEMWK